jgi:hypothetical protein
MDKYSVHPLRHPGTSPGRHLPRKRGRNRLSAGLMLSSPVYGGSGREAVDGGLRSQTIVMGELYSLILAKAGIQCDKYSANFSRFRIARFVSEIRDFGQTGFRNERNGGQV